MIPKAWYQMYQHHRGLGELVNQKQSKMLEALNGSPVLYT
jgi:hypothetical protein